MTSHRSIYRATVAFVLVALGALQGCSDGETPAANGNSGNAGNAGSTNPPRPGQTDFISDSPSSSSSSGGGEFSGGKDSNGAAGTGGSAASPSAGGASQGKNETTEPEDPKKTIEEADIVQIRGSRLYALSRSSGLSIIDVTSADNLKILGRYPLKGEPFEMYVRESTVFAMFSSWGRYECEETETAEGYQSCKWVTSSHIAALDAADPADLKLKGTFDLPGEISDSRIVGDVLYAVSYESGYCWQCSDKPTTTISSLDISDLASIHRVGKVNYDDQQNSGGWGRRSISVTDKRIYVAGVEWDYNTGNQGHSTIQVVDISDPNGNMFLGDSVEAKGQIESRWQMDEYQGVLRVISQPGMWNTQEEPAVQTFKIEGSSKLVPLASVDLKLPKPERLRSVRFDGPRGFAITAEQKDPLFTFDLTDPAQPKQLGELEMPGWVYHMEPRGDRMLALGFDNGNPEGSLNVSLFDISELSKPTMIERVHFGGSWGNFAEDQDRIHKAFTILEDKSLILVPFAGYEQTKGPNGEWWGCGNYKSGIQLVDYSKDALVKRGVAPQKGQARRAFLRDDALFSLSDDKLRTFDISDRDAPAMKSQVGLSHKVSRTASVNGKLVRLAADWWTNEAWLDVVPEADAESVESPAPLDLSAYTGKDNGGCYSSNIYSARFFANGDTIAMIWGDYNYGWFDGPNGGYYSSEPKTHILTIDAANPASPKVIAHSELPFAIDSYYYGYGYYGGYLMDSSDPITQAGSTIAVRRWVYPEASSKDAPKQIIELIDFADPTKPHLASSIQLPAGQFQTNLASYGSSIITSHAEPVPNQPGKIRFFLDRIDASNPASPKLLPKVNIPGSLLHFDGSTGSLVTVDYKKSSFAAQTWEQCYGQGAPYYGGYNKWFDYENKECVSVEKSLRLSSVQGDTATLLDSLLVDTKESTLQGVVFAKNRIFGMTYTYDPKTGVNSQSIVTIQGINEGKFQPSKLLLETGKYWYYGSYQIVGTSDESAVLMTWSNENTVLTLDPAAPGDEALVSRGELRSWASDYHISNGNLIASLQDRGVQVVPLK